MKTKRNNSLALLLFLLPILVFTSCKKDLSVSGATTDAATVSSAAAIAVAASATSGDSIYVINTCSRDHHLDSVSESNLPSSITDYLNSNYAGYTFQKAFSDKDSQGNITGYVAIIQFNGNPVGLKFDASGNFINVLEQREGHDLNGSGWHEGGRFADRDGRHKDTIALSSLPSGILAYISENYPGDTLVKAYKNRDSSYIIFSVNNGAFATTFVASGTFINRVQLHANSGNIATVDESSLPAAIKSYLDSTYPNFVFKQAYSFSLNGIVTGYVVCVDANGTKYAVQFDAAGNFIRSFVVR